MRKSEKRNAEVGILKSEVGMRKSEKEMRKSENGMWNLDVASRTRRRPVGQDYAAAEDVEVGKGNLEDWKYK